ncbi:MAG TPA: phosphate ABC transporter substrate-binding protein PstS family protein [Thermotogota bacterium]|nr:phosphate ABC transporter substrate-binding protein PstS family protein [Thermotogota bacterium]HRW92445.1 phosphate ABC transporter substrate-binding protein PstS family protein [Thermotogota bacterium]
MKRTYILVLLALGLTLGLFANTLVIKGSNTIFPVAQLWIERMQQIQPDVNITLEGAGSSTGIAALFNGTTDIANSSRWLKGSELEKMAAEGKYFIPFVLGYDGIALIVNPQLGLEQISLETLQGIYSGKLKTWRQVDPNLPNQQIVSYSRNTASGTYETFEKIVLNGVRMDPRVRMVESTQYVVDTVAQNPYAIGYVGVGYVSDQVQVLQVEGQLPTKNNILNMVYPISRPLFLFVDATEGFPETGTIKQFLTLAFSLEGQQMVEKAGYIAAYGQ